MKTIMVLADQSETEIDSVPSIGDIRVAAANRADMLITWEKLTPRNLSSLQFKNSDGLIKGNYADLVLTSETSTVAPDGSVLTSYHLREKTSEEKRLDALEAGQEDQNVDITNTQIGLTEIYENMGV